MVADWGGTPDSIKTMEAILSRTNQSVLEDPISAILVAGDLSYANGYFPTWETWLTKMEALFQSTPLLVAVPTPEKEEKKGHVKEPLQKHRLYPEARLVYEQWLTLAKEQ